MSTFDRIAVPSWGHFGRFLLSCCLIALAAVVAIAPAGSDSARAADARLFSAGNIVSDAVFYDGGALTADAVQEFLQARVPSCSSRYACLTTFRQDTPTIAASPGRCAAFDGRTAESAASIIARVGQACGISQKVLIVLLQKEQGLVTNVAPRQSSFDYATGFGCPDTAACDPNVASFFYQIYYAARQYKVYLTSPGSFNYRAGVNNSVLFNPNPACGASTVYIVNAATAGLYNYTPYQPNAAALANMYGPGDGCSSYGNRNFFAYYSDWFGSPTAGSSLIRTSNSPNIWLVSGASKYLIPDSSLLASFSALGQVAYVSQSVIDAYTTMQNATNIIRGTNGAIFFHDASIKLGISTCGLVADYGGTCTRASGYTQLTDFQVSQFNNGPALTNLFGTTTGRRYQVSTGVKHEVLDDRSKAAAGLSGDYPILTDGGIAGLPYGAPIVRDSVFLVNRQSGQYSLVSGGVIHSVDPATQGQYDIAQRISGILDGTSISALPASTAFTGSVSTPGGQAILSGGSSIRWPKGVAPLAPVGPAISQELTSSYSPGLVSVGMFVKSVSGSTVYLVGATDLRPVVSWKALVALAATPDVAIVTLPDSTVAQLAKGPILFQPASLVKTASSPAVFLIDGSSNLQFLSDFAITNAVGITGFSTVADGQLAGYSQGAAPVRYLYSCGGSQYLAAEGSLHPMSPALVSAYSLAATTTSTSTCSQITQGKAASAFIRLSTGAVYQVSDAQRHLVTSMSRYLQLDPTGTTYLNVDDRFASLLPIGPVA